jgi:L-2-hydroxyglutarate oxidase LhgO
VKEYLIIGAGIVGCSLARELLRNRRGKVIILEKERAVGAHASGRNSGVIHSGINQKPGSMKAAMCVEGSRLLREYCRSRRIPFEERGTVVTAFTREERDVLDRLKSMGDACGVPGLRFLSESERLEREPCSQGGKARWIPSSCSRPWPGKRCP